MVLSRGEGWEHVLTDGARFVRGSAVFFSSLFLFFLFLCTRGSVDLGPVLDARPNHAGRVARMRPTLCCVVLGEKVCQRHPPFKVFFHITRPVTGPGYRQGWSGVRPKAVWRVLREHLQQGLPGWPGCVMPCGQCGLLNCSCGLVTSSLLAAASKNTNGPCYPFSSSPRLLSSLHTN